MYQTVLCFNVKRCSVLQKWQKYNFLYLLLLFGCNGDQKRMKNIFTVSSRKYLFLFVSNALWWNRHAIALNGWISKITRKNFLFFLEFPLFIFYLLLFLFLAVRYFESRSLCLKFFAWIWHFKWLNGNSMRM